MSELNKTESQLHSQSNSSRWWDFYLIRYLIGTLIGSIVLYLLLFQFLKIHLLGSGYDYILDNILRLDSNSDFFFLIVGGLAVSYLSSSPILLLHAIRLKLKPRKRDVKERTKTIPITTGVVFFILGIILASLIYYFFHIAIITGVISLIVLLPFALLLFFWLSEHNQEMEKKMKHQYFESVKARFDNPIKEFPESYRHLREHGNAFFIVFTEILFGLALYPVKKDFEVIAVLAVWVVPPVLIWFFANYLEGYLLDKKDSN